MRAMTGKVMTADEVASELRDPAADGSGARPDSRPAGPLRAARPRTRLISRDARPDARGRPQDDNGLFLPSLISLPFGTLADDLSYDALSKAITRGLLLCDV
jgi:hypothetical protein